MEEKYLFILNKEYGISKILNIKKKAQFELYSEINRKKHSFSKKNKRRRNTKLEKKAGQLKKIIRLTNEILAINKNKDIQYEYNEKLKEKTIEKFNQRLQNITKK